MNTELNPRIKSEVPKTTRLLFARLSSSAPESPDTYARYAGTSGNTHGEMNATMPANIAMGKANSTEPDSTCSESENRFIRSPIDPITY